MSRQVVGRFRFVAVKKWASDDAEDLTVQVEIDERAVMRMAAKAKGNVGGQARAGACVVRIVERRPAAR